MNPQECAVLKSLFTKTVSLRTYICQHRACRAGITDKLKNASTRLQELLDTALATHTPSIEKGRDIEYSRDNRFTSEDMWWDRNNSLIKQDEVRTVIHELHIAAEPMPVPHHVPACLDDVFLPNKRMSCCAATMPTKSSYLPTQKVDGVKKRKRSRSQKSKIKSNLQSSADFMNAVFEKENRNISHAKSCRRQRKRQRTSSMKNSTSSHVMVCDSVNDKDTPPGMTITSAKRTHTEAEISCKKGKSDVEQAKRMKSLSNVSASTRLLKRCLMFYGEPKANQQNQISMKLPRNYMLTLPVSKLRNAASSRSRNHVLSSAALDVLLTYIFPKQYRKPNILQGTVTEPATLQRKNPFFVMKPYYRKWRLPPRLQHFKNYFAIICQQHSKMDYKRILDRVCPTKHSGSGADQFSSHAQVCAFVLQCLKEIFPYGIWGSQENFRTISKGKLTDLNKHLLSLLVLMLQMLAVYTYVSLRKFETLSLAQLMRSFKHPSSAVRNAEKRRDNERVSVLAVSVLYNTSPLDVWHDISQPAVSRLISVNFTTFDASKFEFSCLRLLPKGANVRPITNMKRRFQKDANGSQIEQTAHKSANNVLANALRALTFEKEEIPELLGSSIMSFEEFYKTLANYKEWYLSTEKTNSERPNLYFAKVDIKSCFDSIEQDVLLGILDKILSQDEYIIKRYSTMFATTGGKIHFRHKTYAQNADDYDSFQTQALKMSETLPNTIFVDNVLHKFEDRDELLELIRRHIKCNVVKIGSGFYRQTVGIPQGSCLSTMLCSYFYGSMENEELSFLKNDQNALLMRFVDDFICISPNKATVQKFTTTMHKGSIKYGCFVSHAKSLVNFDMMYNGVSVAKLENTFEFPWCGFLIDTRDLEVYSNYQQYFTCHLQDTLTTEFNKHPGLTLVHKGMLTMKPKLRPVFVSKMFNRPETISRNIFEAFLLCAFKLCASASILKYTGVAYLDEQFLLKAIWHIVLTTTHLVKRKLSSLSVIWLGLHAFHLALKRKSRLAPKCQSALEAQLSHDIMQHTGKNLLPLVGTHLRYPFTKIKY
ncbi:hypothetical protein INT43_001891 [Umbelopsis isabellina]|uniref:Telomerase reverse transcriptase n=1 Tax=Mortierella isabellina TaxID=91625 RepID=A0A8H7PRQ4_MORIS|nr:hypothetical protein INT43_001891 [Umbelopsis isabellina]